MAPTLMLPVSLPRRLHRLTARAGDPNNPPLASVFALVIDRAQYLASTSSAVVARSFPQRNTANTLVALQHISHAKRQQTNQVLVIPTTYANLNNSPAPGTVAGITLGAIAGFVLALFLLLWAFRITGYGGSGSIIEEEVIHRHTRSHKQSMTASSASSIPMAAPVMEQVRRSSRRESKRTSRVSRRASHRPGPPDLEEVIVEEEISEQGTAEDEHVVVEEEESDIVEVEEEHSPEPPSRRKPSKRSGAFRTVDPTAYGGGGAPSRRISRNS